MQCWLFFFLESSLVFAAKSPDENLACKSVTLLLALLTWCLPLADEDEDGDRITVRSDEEMKAMLSYVSTATNPGFPPSALFISFSWCIFACLRMFNWAISLC